MTRYNPVSYLLWGVAIALMFGAASDTIVGGNLTVRGASAGTYGELTVTANANATTAGAQNAWVEVGDDLTAGNLNGFTVATSDLTSSTATGLHLFEYDVAFTGSTGKTVEFSVSADDVIISGCTVSRKLGSADVGSAGMHCSYNVSAGEVFKLETRGTDATPADVTVEDVTVFVEKI